MADINFDDDKGDDKGENDSDQDQDDDDRDHGESDDDRDPYKTMTFAKDGISNYGLPGAQGTEIEGEKTKKTKEDKFRIELLNIQKKIDSKHNRFVGTIINNISRNPTIVYKNPYALIATFYVMDQLKKEKKTSAFPFGPKKAVTAALGQSLAVFPEVSKFDILRYMELVKGFKLL